VLTGKLLLKLEIWTAGRSNAAEQIIRHEKNSVGSGGQTAVRSGN
jgi:hypothetical protein